MSTNIWMQPLTQENYQIYAALNYMSNVGTWNEFFTDLKYFTRINKILNTKHKNHNVSLHNLLNIFISAGNVFQHDSLCRLAFFLSNNVECHSDIKTFLYFMHRLPDSIPETDLHKIPINTKLLEVLNSF